MKFYAREEFKFAESWNTKVKKKKKGERTTRKVTYKCVTVCRVHTEGS